MTSSLLSTIWRKQSGTINMSSLTQLNPYLHRQQQPYRQQGMDNLYNQHVLQEHGTQATNLLDNFHRKVHNNREQHGIGRIVNRLHRVSNNSAIGV
jgi:hypothetical protein